MIGWKSIFFINIIRICLRSYTVLTSRRRAKQKKKINKIYISVFSSSTVYDYVDRSTRFVSFSNKANQTLRTLAENSPRGPPASLPWVRLVRERRGSTRPNTAREKRRRDTNTRGRVHRRTFANRQTQPQCLRARGRAKTLCLLVCRLALGRARCAAAATKGVIITSLLSLLL